MKLINFIKGYGITNKPTKMQCTIRIIAGGYIAYIAYKLFMERANFPGGWQSVLMYAAIVIFAIFGVGYCILNLKVYIKGQFFVPGVDDVDQDENSDGTEETKKINYEPEGEISYAAHWVNPVSGDDEEEE